ncbi:MAG: 2-oxo-3-hexenedioate decarboxylase [SAR324 cluster bacterium]|nr:2-oxo-3-hexenedioate decarboxylase [SAR324 cluster bacterium]
MATLDSATKAKLAEHLENAELNAQDVHKITDDYPDMDFEDAYDIQWEIRRRKEARGTKISGLKMGLTSWAKMSQMGVENPLYAFLADYFAVPEGGEIKVSELIHPKIEPEIAVVLKKALKGPGITVANVLAAIDFVVPAIEVIDSRYENFRFDLKSVIADNASSARYTTGSIAKSIDGLDLKSLGVVIEKNGEIVATGAGAAVLGHPALSVAMLANQLAERGEEIPAGCFILTGGITAAIAVEAGDNINVRFQELGNLGLRFV